MIIKIVGLETGFFRKRIIVLELKLPQSTKSLTNSAQVREILSKNFFFTPFQILGIKYRKFNKIAVFLTP